jgi:hypothetical protein
MPPEARNGPSESTPTTQPKKHQTYSQSPTSKLPSLRHIRASPGHLLGLLANRFQLIRAHPLAPPLKQPQTEVSIQQFAVPGGLDRLVDLRKLT